MEGRYNYPKLIFYMLLMICIVIAAAVLKVTAAFSMPVVVSVLLSFVFYPFVKKLSASLKFPWIAGILVVVMISILSFVGIINLLVTSSKAIVSAYPKYESRFESIFGAFAGMLDLHLDTDLSLFQNLWSFSKVRGAIQTATITVSNSALSLIKMSLVIGLLVIFLLQEMHHMSARIRTAFPDEKTGHRIIRISTIITGKVTKYISIKFIISLVTGILVGAYCAIIGLDFAIIWGFIAFILNFIPNFGSAISCGLTTAFALLQFYPRLDMVAATGVILLGINMTLGSIIEPKWEGSNLGVSPFLILVSLSFWGMIWGFSGMVLSVPLLVMMKIIFENISFLKPVANLMGDSKRRSRKKFTEQVRAFFTQKK